MSAIDVHLHAATSISLPADATGGIVLQYYMNNNTATLSRDIRRVLSQQLDRHIHSYNVDIMDDHLQLFAEQIDQAASEMAANASILLQEFDASSSSPISFFSLSDLDAIGHYTHLDGDSDQNSLFNLSLVSNTAYMKISPVFISSTV